MEPRNPDNPFFVIRFLTFLQLLRLAYGEDHIYKFAEHIPVVLPVAVKPLGKRLYVVDWIYGLAGVLAAAFILWNCSQNGIEHLASGMALLMEVRRWLLALLAMAVVAVVPVRICLRIHKRRSICIGEVQREIS
ncbi:MAG TPA: hypothetical protein VI636_14440 [Candidatus Angelobacter sp.]